MNVRLNVVANLVGRVWTVALAFVFLPVYLQFLGVEAYGLVGFFATLQAVFGLLDLGLSATANREMARLEAAGDRREQRDLLRTLEVIYWSVALTAGIVVILVAPAITTRWIRVGTLSPATAITAVRLIGIVTALQFSLGFYQGALMGLGRQVFVNGVLIVFGTLRSAGAAAVLWLLSPTIEAFFAWQALLSLAQAALLTRAAWVALPGQPAPQVVPGLLRSRWVFAASISANALIGVSVAQLDKVLLSRLLTLEQFGYYMIAASAASVVWLAIVPLNQALFPRFTQLIQLGDSAALARVYHRSCQTLTVLVVPITATVVFFSLELIAAWTRSPGTAEQTALIVQLLIIGVTLNGLASLPAQLQAAAGWPQLMLYTNLASAVLLVPVMLATVSRFGPTGAAFVWMLLNSGYVIATVPLMHRRLLRGELHRWYVQDLLMPAATAVGVVGGLRALAPTGLHGIGAVAYAGMAWFVAFGAAAMSAPLVRSALIDALAWRPALASVWHKS